VLDIGGIGFWISASGRGDRTEDDLQGPARRVGHDAAGVTRGLVRRRAHLVRFAVASLRVSRLCGAEFEPRRDCWQKKLPARF